VLFGLITVFSLLCGFIVWRIEDASRKNRKDFLDALNEELAAAERYMRKVAGS
jgi:hypothetical protein